MKEWDILTGKYSDIIGLSKVDNAELQPILTPVNWKETTYKQTLNLKWMYVV